MKKPDCILASECLNMVTESTMMLPTMEHLKYLYSLLSCSDMASVLIADIKRGDEQAVEFYSKQFNEVTK